MDRTSKYNDIMILRQKVVNELFDYFEYSEAY